MGKVKEFLFNIIDDITENYLDIESLRNMDEDTMEDAISGVIDSYINDIEETDEEKAEFIRINIVDIIDHIMTNVLDSFGEEIEETITDKDIAYNPTRKMIRIFDDYADDFRSILKVYKINYSTFRLDSVYGGDNFTTFKFNNEIEYQGARKASRELLHSVKVVESMNEDMDYDAIARRNRERDKQDRFVGGYRSFIPTKPKPISDEDYIDSPAIRNEYKNLQTSKSEFEKDIKDLDIALKDLEDMENILKGQISKLKNIKRNSQATTLKKEIEDKVSELKKLRNDVKKAYTRSNNDIKRVSSKIDKIILKARKGKTLD